MSDPATKTASPPLGVIELHTWINVNAPASDRWSASIREYDLGTKTFSAPTQRAAIDLLLDYYENDAGELHESHGGPR